MCILVLVKYVHFFLWPLKISCVFCCCWFFFCFVRFFLPAFHVYQCVFDIVCDFFLFNFVHCFICSYLIHFDSLVVSQRISWIFWFIFFFLVVAVQMVYLIYRYSLWFFLLFYYSVFFSILLQFLILIENKVDHKELIPFSSVINVLIGWHFEFTLNAMYLSFAE